MRGGRLAAAAHSDQPPQAAQPANADDTDDDDESSFPECLLCCSPMSSFTISTCQHSAQICGTCILRVKLFIKPKKKKEEADADAASSSSPAPVGEDLLNEENDFKPSAAAVAEAEARVMKCPYCHQQWSQVLITRDYDVHSKQPPPTSSSFGLSTDAKYNLRQWVFDSRLNVYFETEATKSKYFMMAGLYCVLCFNLSEAFSKGGNPAKKYDKVHLFLDQAQLEAHLDQKHQRYMCSACTTTRKIFVHEHQVFTRKELTHHFKYGSNSSIVTEYQPSDTAHAGVIDPHPFCQFCEKPYFSNDELYTHLITEHRSCRFCESEGFHRYFRTDAALRIHFGQKHYLCEEGKCKRVEANRAGFRDVLALKTHRLAAHTEGLSKEEIRRMQTIDLDLFRHDTSRRHTVRQNRDIDEFEFRVDDPDSNDHSRFYEDQFDGRAEEFPTLGGASSSSSSSSAAAMSRSHSNPSFTAGAYQNFQNSLASEEAFPTLGGRPAPVIAQSAGAFRGPVPTRDDFPTLRSVVKSDAKQARKQEEKAKATKKATAPAPVTVDNRIVSAVPLPLPAAVSAADLPARNKALVSSVRAALSNDADLFESFKFASQGYRSGGDSATAYLDEFFRLFANNPAGPVETEKLLMDLIATLPEESQRIGLHAEYAKRKVWSQVQSMKKKMKGGNIVSVESNATSSQSSKLTAPAPTRSPAPVQSTAKPAPSPSPSPAPASASSSSSSSSTAARDAFTTVESKADRKASQQAARRAANAQGITAFEGRAAKPLKKEEEGSFLETIVRQKAEEEEREKDRERELAESKRTKKGWTDGAASSIIAPVARGPPGFASLPSSSSAPALSKMSRQNSWTALADEEDEPAQVSEPVPARTGRVPAKYTASSRDDDTNPPLPSSSPSQGGVTLPDPSTLDLHLSTIDALRIPAPAKSKLQFLAMLFHEVHRLIEQRHGDLNAPSNRRFQLSAESRTIMANLMRQTRFQHVWEFTRIARFGLTPSSNQSLNGATAAYTRYGGELLGDSLPQSLRGLSSNELFLLVEYLHQLLTQLTKSAHPDLKEMQASFEKDEARRAAQNDQFRGVPIAANAAATRNDDIFERNSAAASSSSSSAGGEATKKKAKGKQLLFKMG